MSTRRGRDAGPVFLARNLMIGRTLVLSSLVLLSAAGSTAAADPSGFAFLEVPAGARAAALGGAFVSLGEGVEAVFWNPAGLAATEGVQISGSHDELFQNLRHDRFAVAGRLWGGGISGSVRALYSGP